MKILKKLGENYSRYIYYLSPFCTFHLLQQPLIFTSEFTLFPFLFHVVGCGGRSSFDSEVKNVSWI